MPPLPSLFVKIRRARRLGNFTPFSQPVTASRSDRPIHAGETALFPVFFGQCDETKTLSFPVIMLISARNISHQYKHGSGCLHVLKEVNLDIEEKDFLAIMGSSGSGKSTLLHILGCLLKPGGGTCLLRGQDILQLQEKELARLRAETVAHVFQQFHLLPTMNVLENVLLPSLYNNIAPEQAESEAMRAIEQVGLGQRIGHKPNELSGGEMQRVAIARALAVKPDLILADEPTGNLDQDSSREILNLFREINRQGCTVVLVTHDPEIADQAASIKYLRNGRLQ